ncbi:hypothetical protein [Halobellus rubicundus]|uniref:Uncharacterized protein n=1 Tax=Halobellus rubicundus TaxID=2996466 RepID=A0ABD5MC32_9EURY
MSSGFDALTGFLGLVLATVIGSAITRLLISPLVELRNMKAKIDKDISTYRHIITNPGGNHSQSEREDTRYELREDASELVAKAESLPFYWLWSTLQLVPSRDAIENANDNLIFLSNRLSQGDPIENDDKIQEIEDLLNI